jgi:RAP domain
MHLPEKRNLRKSDDGSRRYNNNVTWSGRPIPESIPSLSELMNVTETRESFLLTNSSLSYVKTSQNIQRKTLDATCIGKSFPMKALDPAKYEVNLENGNHNPSSHEERPWKADYETSRKSQTLIQSAVNDVRRKAPLDRAVAVLETFLSIPPGNCNAANVVCALTLSAKTMGRETSDHFRSLLFRTNNVLYQLLEEQELSTRQLCNAVWALAKHYDRDDRLLPRRPDYTTLSSDTILGQAELWDLRSDLAGSPTQHVDATIDEIARQLTATLRNDVWAAKEGELCMACWAYGILRRRRRPPGWQNGPQLSNLPTRKKAKQDHSYFIKFEEWKSIRKSSSEKFSDVDISVTGEFLDSVGRALSVLTTTPINDKTFCIPYERIRRCTWNELANVAWAFAAHGRACSPDTEVLLKAVAAEAARRLNDNDDKAKQALSRDIAQIIWSIGVLQSDNFRLGDGLLDFVCAVSKRAYAEGENVFLEWSCPDIVQVMLSLAHARIDDPFLIKSLFKEACCRFHSYGEGNNVRGQQWKAWETSILLWAQARLHLTDSYGEVFGEFSKLAVTDINALLKQGSSFQEMGIGPQEQANIAWSLTVLEMYNNPEAMQLLESVFAEAASSCQRDGVIQLEHAHQLWQSLYLLQDESPKCVATIPQWFKDYLREKWFIEKSRLKISSARHISISKTLKLMGVAHYNEHDEDIDVAIVLKPEASWTHETESSSVQSGVRVAVEFDGPYHFTRQSNTVTGSKAAPPRALGHTVLKYRLLKKQGWTVVRVPYYEYDKIPFWASMERQRYLQRLLKTHGNLRFSHVDVSAYKVQVPNRGSRFD